MAPVGQGAPRPLPAAALPARQRGPTRRLLTSQARGRHPILRPGHAPANLVLLKRSSAVAHPRQHDDLLPVTGLVGGIDGQQPVQILEACGKVLLSCVPVGQRQKAIEHGLAQPFSFDGRPLLELRGIRDMEAFQEISPV